jgi:hypothetical protein
LSNKNIIDAIITPDKSRIIVLITVRSPWGTDYSNLSILVFNVNDILNANDGDNVTEIQNVPIYSNNSGKEIVAYPFSITSNTDGTLIYVYGDSNSSYKADLWSMSVGLSQNLLGVVYNNQFFRSIKSGLLNASASDVASGKTFIGSNGTVETGTGV